MQGRPELVLRVFLTAFDDVPDEVQGAPELPDPRCDVDAPVVPRPLPCEVPVLLREPLDDPRGITRGSIRGVDPVS